MFKKYDAYLMGYYGMQNTGDDVLLYATRWASKHLLDSPFHIVSSALDAKSDEFGDIHGLPDASFRGHHRLLHYKNALQSEKVIFGGGSVLHSEKDIQFKRHLIKLAGQSQSRCAGVGLGPFENVAAEKACGKLLSECGFVGIRDLESLEIAKDLAPDANVKLTFDLAPLLLCQQTHDIVPIERKGIMFNFCPQATDAFGRVNSGHENRRVVQAVETIKRVWQLTNEPIYLLDFNGHPVSGDEAIHQQIMDNVPDHVQIHHIPYDPNPFYVLQRIAGFKASVCMRLHAAILSFMVKTPSISINYHKKCKGWCEQIGVPEKYQFDAQNVCPDEISKHLEQGLGMGFALPTMKIDEAIQATMLNWR